MIISKIIDRHTYLHFAAGIIAYYWGFTIVEWIAVHILLDIFQRGLYLWMIMLCTEIIW